VFLDPAMLGAGAVGAAVHFLLWLPLFTTSDPAKQTRLDPAPAQS
jgi:hypothetical protein